jgi:hypothetical protein
VKIYVQDALRTARDYQLRDSSEWATYPFKPLEQRATPAGPQQLNNTRGWVISVGVQGIDFEADHVAVQDLNDGSGGIKVTIWDDSPIFRPLGSRTAQVWTLLPLAPDSRFGGAMNTRQSRVVYAEQPYAYPHWQGLMPVENTVLKEWPEFETTVLPTVAPLARHGIWITDDLWLQHLQARTQRGWRDWLS